MFVRADLNDFKVAYLALKSERLVEFDKNRLNQLFFKKLSKWDLQYHLKTLKT